MPVILFPKEKRPFIQQTSLKTYYVPGTVLSPRDKRLKDTISALKELTVQWGEKKPDNYRASADGRSMHRMLSMEA